LHRINENGAQNFQFLFGAEFSHPRYIAILRLHEFGCEMPIRANFGEFLRILTPKMWNHWFYPQRYALLAETCILRYCLLQDAQLSQRDRAVGCVIVFAKSRRLELGDNILRTL